MLKRQWTSMALIPFVLIMLGSIGNRIGAAPDQNQAVDWGDNGFIIQGGITPGQVLRFNVARLANVNPGPPNSNAHPGGVNLELRVFDSQGNILASNTYVFPQNQNYDPDTIQSSFFDLNAAQLPASAFDSSGRAQVTGIVRAPGPHVIVAPGPPGCGFVASGEIFNFGDVNRQTLVHIAGAPISKCNGR